MPRPKELMGEITLIVAKWLNGKTTSATAITQIQRLLKAQTEEEEEEELDFWSSSPEEEEEEGLI